MNIRHRCYWRYCNDRPKKIYICHSDNVQVVKDKKSLEKAPSREKSTRSTAFCSGKHRTAYETPKTTCSKCEIGSHLRHNKIMHMSLCWHLTYQPQISDLSCNGYKSFCWTFHTFLDSFIILLCCAPKHRICLRSLHIFDATETCLWYSVQAVTRESKLP